MRPYTDSQIASIPMQQIGPVEIISEEVTGSVSVPLATFESPLWSSTHRGALLSQAAGGIRAVIVDDRMTRSILVETNTATDTYRIYLAIQQQKAAMQRIVEQSSRFAKLIDMHAELVGSMLYLRFEFLTGDASGHNMTTIAADNLLQWLLQQYPLLRYVSISGNFCTDKKVSAVNGILGRGKNVIAEITVSRAHCARFLKTTPEKIIELNIKKNLIGSIVAGGIRSANAHYANILLGFYLATGQDAANLIEGSQGITFTELREDALYFSVTLPNVIVGTVGNGKTFEFVKRNLSLMGCDAKAVPGLNARRLAIIATAAVLCGEISLLAAQTNVGELTRSHVVLERKRNKA